MTTLLINNLFEKIKTVLVNTFLVLTGLWLAFALSFQLFCVYLMVTNQDQRASDISNKIAWRIDGTFKNNPDNIWYEGPKK